MRQTAGIVIILLLAGFGLSVEPVMPRHPAPSPDGTVIAFSWQGDIWLASAAGGAARRLTANPGYDGRPVWLPGGTGLAFTSNRDGGDDAYILDVAAGTTRRLTHHEAADTVMGGLGADVVFTSARFDAFDRMPAIYRIPVAGGTESLLARVLALEAVPSPDGRRLALVRGGTPAQRRHYRGAASRDLWLLELNGQKLERLTDTPWDEDGVSWAGNDALVFRSDNGGPDRNLFRLDLASRAQIPLTRHTGADVRAPRCSADGRLVAYEFWDALYTVAAAGGAEPRRLTLDVPADSLLPAVERKTYTADAEEIVPSPDGKQVALIVAGDVFVVARWPKDAASVAPAPTVRVTTTPARERHVAWSPDGKGLVYASDRDGQLDLYSARPAGRDDGAFVKAGAFVETRLTQSPADEFRPKYSPDGRHLAYLADRGTLTVAAADGSGARALLAHWTEQEFVWSPDSRWLAVSREDQAANSDILILPAAGGDAVNISQHPGIDTAPVWSPDGRRLYWLSKRHASTLDVWAVYLRRADHERSPEEWQLLFDEEAGKKAKPEDKGKTAGDDTAAKAKEPPVPPVEIDFAEIHERARLLHALPGDEGDLAVSPDGHTVVFSAALDGERDLYKLRWDGKELKRLTTGDTRPAQPAFSKDGKQVLYRTGRGTVGVTDLEGKPGDPVAFTARHEVERAALRRQVYEEAWRELERGFYDPAFHGADWAALRDRYRPLALGASTREDFEEVQNLLGGELNASHMRFTAAGAPRPVPTGELGLRVEPAADGTSVTVTDILAGSPAARVDAGLRAGDRILAVNGRRLAAGDNFFALLADTVRQRTVLRVTGVDGERDVELRPAPFAQRRQDRYRAWVKERRALVERWSGGKLGYIHIQGMDAPSLEEFERDLFAAAHGKQGLLIDVRNNGGGWTTDYLMAMLSVRRHAWTVPRGADPAVKAYPDAERLLLSAWTRPALTLCDQDSYSNAEIFSWAFKTTGRGSVVGMPTFGAVISTGGARLTDGSFVRLPGRGWYVAGSGTNQENNGCVPDVIVVQPPEQDFAADADAQLARAVEVLLAQLPASPDALPW
ncbi:MAG TPA: S41 family peptidase [Acidobacteriota bacterium]|nr:S41 family peptidase [Acidobacteriota bacterium]HQG93031.1 S41 family peptidase [Acidobacteriota bacterium]HQK86322.1 S41 family peptidase [Acidobacteriota bacterium]